MQLDKLNKALSNQYLITHYMLRKLDVVNFIKEGYDLNEPILINNRFLHFSAQVYYRSIPIDLYALFGPATGNNKNAFGHILKKRPEVLDPAACLEIEKVLDGAFHAIEVIKDLRHTQFAHYDFTKLETISLNMNDLSVVNNLSELAKRVVMMFGKAFIDEEQRISYHFNGDNDYIRSLVRLIDKVK